MTQISVKGSVAKLAFILGAFTFFLSLFIDWYSFGAMLTDGTVVADWTFNSFLGWTSSFLPGISSNEDLKPSDASEMIVMTIGSVLFVLICVYGVIFKSVEKTNSTKRAEPYIYCCGILLILNGYYLVFLPCSLLVPNDLYFPFLHLTELETGVIYSYSISAGYLMQVISFVALFPYSIFALQTLRHFEAEKRSPEVIVENYVKKTQESIPLEMYIAEEEQELKNKRANKPSIVLYKKFQKRRGAR